MLTTPIVLFNFNRPDFTKRALDKLRYLSPRRIYLVCDGARGDNPSELSRVKQVQELLCNHGLAGEVFLLFANSNMGLKLRFLSALDEIFSCEEQLIVLEDDCEVDDSFFYFCKLSLQEYSGLKDVGLISAHNPTWMPFKSAAFFTTYPRIWGWATWSSVWWEFRSADHFDLDSKAVRKGILSNVNSVTMKLLFSRMLRNSFADETWDVRWASFLLASKKLALSPPVNLVRNVGVSGTQTHSQDWSHLELPRVRPFSPVKFPLAVRGSALLSAWEDALRFGRWFISFSRSPRRFIGRALRGRDF